MLYAKWYGKTNNSNLEDHESAGMRVLPHNDPQGDHGGKREPGNGVDDRSFSGGQRRPGVDSGADEKAEVRHGRRDDDSKD